MTLYSTVPGQEILDQFSAFEDDGVTKRSGLTLGGGDFLVTVWKDCVVQAPATVALAITEIGASGEYCLSYTPPSEGYWEVEYHIVFSDDICKSKAAVGSSANLSTVIANLNRALSLLHYNSMVDNQEYADANGQLTAWRHRGFDTASNVPTDPGGSETTGLVFEHQFEAEYDGANKPKKLRMTKVQ